MLFLNAYVSPDYIIITVQSWKQLDSESNGGIKLYSLKIMIKNSMLENKYLKISIPMIDYSIQEL